MQKNINLESYGQLKSDMPKKNVAIFAMFLNQKSAKAAIKSLKSDGFSSEDIFMLVPNKSGSRDFVYHQATDLKTGAMIGAAVGFLLLGLVGLIVGSYDPFQQGMSSWIIDLTIGAITGLVVGAATGALVGIGIPKSAIKRYRFYLKEGGVVVMMHLKNEEDGAEAHHILEKSEGQDITVLEESQVWSNPNPENKRPTFH